MRRLIVGVVHITLPKLLLRFTYIFFYSRRDFVWHGHFRKLFFLIGHRRILTLLGLWRNELLQFSQFFLVIILRAGDRRCYLLLGDISTMGALFLEMFRSSHFRNNLIDIVVVFWLHVLLPELLPSPSAKP